VAPREVITATSFGRIAGCQRGRVQVGSTQTVYTATPLGSMAAFQPCVVHALVSFAG